MAAPTKVLYIAGSGRSRTTLFGHILGQVPGFCFIAERPRPAVESILRMVANRPLALPFVGERTVTLGRTHSIKGNPNRLQVGAVEIAVDDQWKTGMAAADRRLVTVLTWPLLAHYSYLGGARHPDPQPLEPENVNIDALRPRSPAAWPPSPLNPLEPTAVAHVENARTPGTLLSAEESLVSQWREDPPERFLRRVSQ